MRIGLQTPVVIQVPATASAWEATAGVAEIGEIAAVADLLGIDYLTCSEHVVVPTDVAATRGATYWDPLATLAFIAGRTSRIRLATSQKLVAVALLEDGSAFSHTVDVVVTLAACIE